MLNYGDRDTYREPRPFPDSGELSDIAWNDARADGSDPLEDFKEENTDGN